MASEDSTTEEYDSLFANIRTLAEQMNGLHLIAVRETRPTVERIIRSGSRDQRAIERTLDCLLDHACIPEGLDLFKALCRHYYRINPVATSDYVYAYRDLWGSGVEGEEEIPS